METSELIRSTLLRRTRRPTFYGQSGVSRRRGDGYEFAELRAYMHGDDLRRVDWSASARAGALQTRVMLEEHALLLAGIIDDSESMFIGCTRTLFSLAQDALSLWYQASRSGDKCFRIGSDSLLALPAHLVRRHPQILTHHSLPVPNLNAALQRADALLPAGSALLVISDLWQPPDEAILYRLGARHDVALLFARDPWHANVPLRGIVRLRDSETGRQARIFLGKRERARYHEAMQKREEDLRRRFIATGWRFGFLQVDADADIRELFQGPSRVQDTLSS